jgi:hypothetical protein
VQQLATSARALCRSRAGTAPLHGPNWAPEYAQTQDIPHPALHILHDSAHWGKYGAETASACKSMVTAIRRAAAGCWGAGTGTNPKSLTGVIPAAAAPAGAVWSVDAGRCPGGGVYAAYGCEDGLVCTLEAAVPRDTRLQQPAPTAACGGASHPVDAPWHGHRGPAVDDRAELTLCGHNRSASRVG